MKRFPIILPLLMLLTSCLHFQGDGEAVVADWVGKEIVMPIDLKFQIIDHEIDINSQVPDFKSLILLILQDVLLVR